MEAELLARITTALESIAASLSALTEPDSLGALKSLRSATHTSAGESEPTNFSRSGTWHGPLPGVAVYAASELAVGSALPYGAETSDGGARMAVHYSAAMGSSPYTVVGNSDVRGIVRSSGQGEGAQGTGVGSEAPSVAAAVPEGGVKPRGRWWPKVLAVAEAQALATGYVDGRTWLNDAPEAVVVSAFTSAGIPDYVANWHGPRMRARGRVWEELAGVVATFAETGNVSEAAGSSGVSRAKARKVLRRAGVLAPEGVAA